jgi:GTP diphosphokinase / guanosine-3',5'-bis(diphosphate) 3'-diphosphatase
MIAKAKSFAIEKHKGQKRKFSDERYVEHSIRVAKTVLGSKDSHELDTLVAAALLHDVVEDTKTKVEEIQNIFGDKVACLVEELTSRKGIRKEEKAEYLSEKMLKMSSWALVIKLADRLDNVSGIEYTSKDFKERYSKETREILSKLESERTLSDTHKKLIEQIKLKIL